MNKLDRITSDPAILDGQPIIRGMRLTVRRVVEALALYPDWNDLRIEYPELEPDDIRQALAFAANNLDDAATEDFFRKDDLAGESDTIWVRFALHRGPTEKNSLRLRHPSPGSDPPAVDKTGAKGPGQGCAPLCVSLPEPFPSQESVLPLGSFRDSRD